MIGVVCALDWELAHLRARLPCSEGERFAGRCTYVAEPFVLLSSGTGMLKAAAATEWLISAFAPTAVLNYGCAGAHRPDLRSGDLVVGTVTVAYDNVCETPAGDVVFAGKRMECDARLIDCARAAAQRFADVQVVYGTVASADRWNRLATTIARVVEQHDSVCEDMEAAAIHAVCALHEVPFLTLKDISNNELVHQTAGASAMLAEIGPDGLARRAGELAFETLRCLHRWD